jgi:hypothetical protein
MEDKYFTLFEQCQEKDNYIYELERQISEVSQPVYESNHQTEVDLHKIESQVSNPFSLTKEDKGLMA